MVEGEALGAQAQAPWGNSEFRSLFKMAEMAYFNNNFKVFRVQSLLIHLWKP